ASKRVDCHPHVVLGNGLDLSHVVPVHRFHFEGDPIVEPRPPHSLSIEVHGLFERTWMRSLLGFAGRSARWRFTTIGPSLAWMSVFSPIRFDLVWAASPLPDGGCTMQILFFLRRWSALIRVAPMMMALTAADVGVLRGLEFRPGFVASDAVFARYAQLIEEIPTW